MCVELVVVVVRAGIGEGEVVVVIVLVVLVVLVGGAVVARGKAKSGIDVWSEIGDAEEASKVKARTEVG